MNDRSSLTLSGGIRYGRSFWLSLNFSAPFSKLQIAGDRLVLSVSFLGFYRRTFEFPREAIRQLHWRRGLFCSGVQIEHDIAGYPNFILFWPLGSDLREDLGSFDYKLESRKEN
jgi:hypothetical protein